MVDYDALLEVNKKAYKEGIIDKDAYAKEARKIRRLRRKAGQAPSQKNGKGPKNPVSIRGTPSLSILIAIGLIQIL